MKVIAIVLISLLCFACGSTTTKSSSSRSDGLFKMSMRMGCNMKYPNSTEMCECQANVLDEVTPSDLKSRFVSDPNAKMELVGVMIKNSDKLDACGERPKTAKKKKEVPTECYPAGEKPAYYVNTNERSTLSLTKKQEKLIASVDGSVTMEELENNFYSTIADKMNEQKKLLNSALSAKGKESSSSIDDIFEKTTKKTVQCSGQGLRKFYTADELEALYKLYYAGYPLEEAREAIFKQSIIRRNLEGVSDIEQKNEFAKLFKCELTMCMHEKSQ